jgi:hypothetical protein
MTSRHTIKPEIAEKLGLTINSSNKYRISAEQREELAGLTDHPALQAEAEAVGLPMNNVRQYWYKGKNFSIQVSNSKADINFDDIVSDLTHKLKKHSPKYKSFKRVQSDDPHLLVIDPADIHFGKLASAYETGEDYNIHIAKQRVIDGFYGILNKSKGFNIEKVLIVVGNDVLHVDNGRSTTTSGTFQDSDVMFHTMFNTALETFVQLVESIISDYDVDIVFNPSNHDYASGWMFARTLAAWFRTCDNVKVMSDIKHRKYYQYGRNMIGTTHGNGAKIQDLPLLMANEEPQMWADTTFRYIYTHHVHHKQVTKFQSGKDYIGVTIESLRSPSAADSWHVTNGFCGAKKAIEGFVHSMNYGAVARLSHYF